MTTPKIEPINIKGYTVKQSKYETVGKLPCRSILCAPSGGGKTVLLQNMVLQIYKDCFDRIYIFSPSIEVDSTWIPVKEYIKKHIDLEPDEEIYFDHYDPKALHDIIDTQHKIIDYMKKKHYKKLFQILIIIDDFADDPSFTRQSKMLHSLYVRGRHNMISTITATQQYNAIHPIVRVNATELYVYRFKE